MLTPNEFVLMARVPNDRAKFGDNRLKIADARVVTTGRTVRTVHACYTLHSVTMREKNVMRFHLIYKVWHPAKTIISIKMHKNGCFGTV